MRIPRFQIDTFAPDPIRLTGPEARHALRVLRLGVGAAIRLFDGRGLEADGRIARVGRDEVVVELLRAPAPAPPPASRLVLAVPPPKGERADWLVEKAAELGVGQLVWLRTERGQADPGAGKLARWGRKAVQAGKQAGRSRITDVTTVSDLAAVLTAAPAARRFFGRVRSTGPSLIEELGAVTPTPCPLSGPPSPIHILFIVGPEGGLTDAEQELLEREGCRPVSLGRSILRIETAAVAAACIWSCWDATLEPR